MSQEKAQLIAPLGNVTFTGVTATGVITATSLEGNITGAASSIKQGTSVTAGVVTASSFAGNLTGNIQRLADSGPNISVGVVTATSFSGNLTGSVTDLTGTPNITVGVVTATRLQGTLTGDVTGAVTGNVSGVATGSVTGTVSGLAQAGLGINYNGGWTGAGTSQISAGVVTATSWYGDGSNLDGVSSGPVSQQAVTINGANTTIDLSNGNLIYATQSADTTVSFANSENGSVYFIRVKDQTDTARSITWPDRLKWEGGSAPTLLNVNKENPYEGQVFLLVTSDEGVTWYGKEVVNINTKVPYSLWVVGNANQGALGFNNIVNLSSPTQLPGTNWGTVYSQLGIGAEGPFAVATKTDSTMWTWGYNNFGTLGDGSRTTRSSPVQLPGTTWDTVTVGWKSVAAVKTDGTLWGWGHNQAGNLGDNTDTQRSSPVQVGTDTTWSTSAGTASKGDWFTHAIKSDGSLWGWGMNETGELGLNTSVGTGIGGATVYSSPMQIGTDTNWRAIAAGYKHALATKTDGTIWEWGISNYGVSGQNTPAIRHSSPTQIGTDTTWKDPYVLNYYNAYATKTDGTLWSWGQNNGGQLGHNNETLYSSPTQVGTDTTWSSLGGEIHAIKTDGTLWWWGDNAYGRAGTNNQGNPSNRSSPTQVGTDTDWIAVTNMGSNILFNRALS